MFVPPKHQDNTRTPARGAAGSRPANVPAYYLARPASLWLNITGSARQARRTQAAGR